MGKVYYIVFTSLLWGCAGTQTAVYEPDSIGGQQVATSVNQEQLANNMRRVETEQKNAVLKEQQKATALREAYAQLQADANRSIEEDRKKAIIEDQQKKIEEERAAEECSRNRECVAASVCWRVEQNKMWKRAIEDEKHNPAGVVDMRRLHEYGQAIQENDYYVQQNLIGTKFTVTELCKSSS